MKKITTVLFSAIIVLNSCKKNDDSTTNNSNSSLKGAFILNEGQFQKGNASIVQFNQDNNTLTYDLYKSANSGVGLGETVQSLVFGSEKAFISVKGANKVVVANSSSLKHISEVALYYPNYTLLDKGNVYVTGGQQFGKVYRINEGTGVLDDSVSVGNSPQKMLVDNQSLLVANNGYWNSSEFTTISDSTISVIGLSDFKEQKKIVVGYKPLGLVRDANNKIWAITAGKGKFDKGGETAPALVEIKSDMTIGTKLVLGNAGNNISGYALSADKKYLYLRYSTEIKKLDIAGASMSTFKTGSYYGVDVDPKTGDVYLCNAKDFSSQGSLTILTSAGVAKGSDYPVGVVPNGVVFN